MYVFPIGVTTLTITFPIVDRAEYSLRLSICQIGSADVSGNWFAESARHTGTRNPTALALVQFDVSMKPADAFLLRRVTARC